MKHTAKLNYLHIAPRKARLVAGTLRNLSINEAEALLIAQPQRANDPFLKLLRSAVAGAKAKKMDPEKMVICEARVDQGPMLKRFMMRARGSASMIQKKMSHLTLTLEERENVKKARFTIVKPKKVKPHAHAEDKPRREKKPQEHSESISTKQKKGFLKRMFSGKSRAAK